MGLWDIFVTASVPVLNVLLLTAVGSIYATSRVGILGQDTRKLLNNVVFYIFNPALVASNLSSTFSLESMILLWFMPVNLVLNSLVGSALGWILIQITKAPKRLRAVILASCSVGNVGNLFLVLVPAMCKEKSSPLHNPGVCETYAMAYASLSMAIGTILQWSYVYNIVRISSSYKEHKENDYSIDGDHPNNSGRLSMKIYTGEIASTNKGMVLGCSSIEDPPVLEEYDQSMNKTKIILSSKINGLLRKLSRAVDIKKLFAPSTIGVIIGFIVGATPQIKNAMVGENAPLRMVQDSLTLLGNGTIPSLILITGGNLIKGFNGPGIKISIIIGIIAVRFVALPVIGTIFIHCAVHFGLVHSDPLYHLVLYLQNAVPPAMNIASMIQMFDAGEGELSVIFLWSYVAASGGLTLWSMLFLWLVS
ncbi:hypothetical protein KFK09_017283 [Dendrobium nobile]|uniref:Auxin efflux carrier family protein n=1 Tax=Dendrobium nobile TaxID=94219 RepID=A0A8T3B6Z5_DENNO|nr:hypothetical protein KFK09_017283 [Dendrobium nobile]